MSATKSFPLRVLLTVTTGRLLTEPNGDSDNGIGDLYELLWWMTSDDPCTHQLVRFAEVCKPHLMRWFPELAACSCKQSLDNLDKWCSSDRTRNKSEAMKMWLTELHLMLPELKDEYDVPRMPEGSHASKDPLAELAVMIGGAA